MEENCENCFMGYDDRDGCVLKEIGMDCEYCEHWQPRMNFQAYQDVYAMVTRHRAKYLTEN